jgi:hypothetical protein
MGVAVMAKQTKRRSVAIGASDLGTAERERHGGIVIEDRTLTPGGVVVAQGARAKVECRLDWYWHRCVITDRQHEAGLRFRSLFEAATSNPRVTGSYGESRGGSASLNEMDARADLASVMVRSGIAREVQGEGLKLLPAGKAVWNTAGMDEWASGDLPLLRQGLAALADHWRISGN